MPSSVYKANADSLVVNHIIQFTFSTAATLLTKSSTLSHSVLQKT